MNMQQKRKNVQEQIRHVIQKIYTGRLHPVTLITVVVILLSTLLITTQQAHAPSVATANLLAGVGGSLLAGQIQRWYR